MGRKSKATATGVHIIYDFKNIIYQRKRPRLFIKYYRGIRIFVEENKVKLLDLWSYAELENSKTTNTVALKYGQNIFKIIMKIISYNQRL